MSDCLDLYDIQGNIVKAYGRFDFPFARYVFYQIKNPIQGRVFIKSLLRYITTSEPWGENDISIPKVTTNIAFTYSGLKNLGIPRKSLLSFPQEFVMGMKARKDILHDVGLSAPEHWDIIWQTDNEESPVDIWLSIDAQSLEALEERYQIICTFVKSSKGGVEQLTGHSGPNYDYQDASSVLDENGNPTPKEHFGYRDGISDPYFKGSVKNGVAVVGGGKPTRLPPDTAEGWEPLETGEFVLGYRDESQEYPSAPIPKLLSHNGSYLVYRKLHQNVGSFNRYIKEMGQSFPGGKEALAAKFAGRWRNGAPITSFPTEAEANAFMIKLEELEFQRTELKEKMKDAKGEELEKLEAEKARLDEQYYPERRKLVAFDYRDDQSGAKCPFGSHIRRVNPRDGLEFGKEVFKTPGALTNRRRLLRRGLPYGKVTDDKRDDGNHGIILMIIGASIERQFEFVQQQWINYGNDFHLANDKDPILGNHEMTEDGRGKGRMTIETAKAKDEETQKPPFLCANLTPFVETRGGDYFFIPSLTALRMIGEGTIDPT
jgi:Dyp-type peroxidase family